MTLIVDTIIERDGSCCVWCGREPWRRDLTAEHLVPRSRGGRTSLENLAVACRACNRARGTRPVVAFVRALIRDGQVPREERILAALGRLAASDRRDLAGYGERQLALMHRLLDERELAGAAAGA